MRLIIDCPIIIPLDQGHDVWTYERHEDDINLIANNLSLRASFSDKFMATVLLQRHRPTKSFGAHFQIYTYLWRCVVVARDGLARDGAFGACWPSAGGNPSRM